MARGPHFGHVWYIQINQKLLLEINKLLLNSFSGFKFSCSPMEMLSLDSCKHECRASQDILESNKFPLKLLVIRSDIFQSYDHYKLYYQN